MPLDPYYSEKLFCNAGSEVKDRLVELTKSEARPLYEVVDDALRSYLTQKGVKLKSLPKRLELAKQLG